MDVPRIRRLAEVLVASQMRSGRSGSDPRSFFGRPRAILVADAVVFLLLFAGAETVTAFLHRVDPALVSAIAPRILAFLPLLALSIVLIAGVMFELSTTSRFASSDAANWLPITPVEYVLASSLAAAFSYSITLSLALGVGLGVAVVASLVGPYVLAAVLSTAALFFGGVLIEILRSSTQRISSVVAQRTGRATLVLRILLFLVVILGFESAFNPVFLLSFLQAVSTLGPWSYAVPLFWPSRAVDALVAGDPWLAGALAVADGMLIAAAAWFASRLRVRFWAPVAAELRFERHDYASAHPVLRAIGLAPQEASLVAKDLRGLVRRRELLPILVTPIVIAVFSLLSSRASGSDAGSSIGAGILVAWVPGFFALLLSATSFGQERRAIHTLFALPIPPSAIFRAKLAVAFLPALVFGVVFWSAPLVLYRWPGPVAIVTLALVVTVAAIGACLGLTFAARWSDFQERPRPQFLRPLAMLGALAIGIGLSFGIALPVLFWTIGGAPLTGAGIASVLVPLAVGAVAAGGFYAAAKRGTDQFLQQVPI